MAPRRGPPQRGSPQQAQKERQPHEPQHSDRTRLAYQFRRGNKNMDDDSDLEQSFPISSFALGSTRSESRAVKFMKGFGSGADETHSRLSFNTDRRWIYVYLIPTEFSTTPPAFLPLEMEIPFEDIVNGGVRVIRSQAVDGDLRRVTLTVTARRPARFYTNIPGERLMRRATERDFVFSVGPGESTAGRSVDEMKAKGYIIHEGHAGPLEVLSDDPYTVKVNAWLTWEFSFMLDAEGRHRFREKILNLDIEGKKDGLDLLAPMSRKVRVVPPEKMIHIDPNTLLARLPFRIRYLVEGLVSHGIIVPSEIPELTHLLDKNCGTNEAALDLKERVLTALFNEERIQKLSHIVFVRTKQLRKRRLRGDEHQVMVYKCLVTPTRVCLFPPESETSNDALRSNALKTDRFLRVQFADEDDRIQINVTVLDADTARPANGTIARVRRALNAGLNLAGRHYKFLAYGSSSAREHSCWFLAEDDNFTTHSVRRNLGFEQITEKIVAKHAARMGIPFSATRAVTIQTNVRNKKTDSYYVDGDQKVCYTDGVGLCGVRVARQAAKAFGFNGVDAYPSAIQIRCGGIKGVLSVWPDLCGSHDVAFRDSQIKFPTNRDVMKRGLNVVRTSQFHRAFLNRQFILLLSHLGVPDRVFEQLFHDAIVRTRGLPQRFTAGLQTESDLRAAVGLSEFPIKELALAGFHHNPMFKDACRVLETRLLANLKWKARLEIKKSVYLIGIADELGVLKEGQVFCQYENPVEPDEGPVVVRGACAVMRAPALHPGDVRIVQAVDHPRLRHLRNVIVFSCRGKPLPNMLAGGDLDGDDYTLIWDDRLLPHFQEEPADYTAPPTLKVNHVTLDNVKEFFVDYIKNDILGQVSNAHLAHADRIGPQSPICLQLANQASIAVDFPKTGVPAKLGYEMRPKTWPDFMGKALFGTAKSNYESKKILGKLFRLAGDEPLFFPTDIRMIVPANREDKRLERYDLPASVLEDAYKLKEEYDSSVLGLMRRYRITEAEVVSGIILKNEQRRRGRDADLKEPVDQNYRTLVSNVLELADRFLVKRAFKGPLSPRMIYGIAAYQITYVDRVRDAVRDNLRKKNQPLSELLDEMTLDDATETGSVVGSTVDGATDGASSAYLSGPGPAPFISFPWVFWEALCDLPNVRVAN